MGAICEQMVGVVEHLDNESRLKLGGDLAAMLSLGLGASGNALEARVGGICASVGSQSNDLVKLLLMKENTELLLSQPALLTQIIHDTVKYYGGNKDFDAIVPVLGHLVDRASRHSWQTGYAVTEACHLLLKDAKTDVNALMRLRAICVDKDVCNKLYPDPSDFTQLYTSTRLASLLQLTYKEGTLSRPVALLFKSLWETAFTGRYPHPSASVFKSEPLHKAVARIKELVKANQDDQRVCAAVLAFLVKNKPEDQ